MGRFFSLSAEIGLIQANAKSFAEYFNNISLVLSDGEQFSWKAGGFLEAGGKSSNWWCMVCPKKADGRDIDVLKDWQQMNELAPLLYDRLQFAPPFRYAIVGIEVDEFRTYEELFADDLIKEEPEKFSGLVISEEIWKKLDSPQGFVSFKQGYFWIPFCPLTY